MNFSKDITKFIKCSIDEIYVNCENEQETLKLAMEFSKYLHKGDIISLNGELGSGKTVFMKGVARYYNIESEVSSPTFTIVNEYDTPLFPIYHFDVYRIDTSRKFEDTIGLDYFYSGLCIIEWGNIIDDILPPNTIVIDIYKTSETGRKFHIRRKI